MANFDFLKAKDIAMENLEAIRLSLARCVDEGMIDLEDLLYNEILGLIDDVSVMKTWEEMEELVAKAKIVEQDVAAWLAMHGRTSVSLPWPRQTKSN
ncbi:MAG: hypothetical protein KGJ02_06285 [Verrucomicrobiota bacterium]|nr:hypothetical protein [Verrucomicrobiota bacterium]